ncbi:anti-sigma factor family protein [Paludisphaera rhizosphaerae]|uniref:anti-sigma factor family protein n=1 Tax=Paludisphaera rhizosphaerae TaxID=2711216 RepID=UPI00197F2640|nr:hypothetical protein [Paludisphaera rhizosphaerae]
MKRLRRLRSILTLACDSASELASRQLDEPLDLVDRLALGGHLIICPPCRRFRRQIQFLRKACRQRTLGESIELDALSAEARARILRTLHDASPDERRDV